MHVNYHGPICSLAGFHMVWEIMPWVAARLDLRNYLINYIFEKYKKIYPTNIFYSI